MTAREDVTARLAAALASAEAGCWDYEPCCWASVEALAPTVEALVAEAVEAERAATFGDSVRALIDATDARPLAALRGRIETLAKELDAVVLRKSEMHFLEVVGLRNRLRALLVDPATPEERA